MVRRFTLGGASVATTARSPLLADQQAALFVQADLGTQEGVQEVADRILQEWGGVDVLVNNLGGSDVLQTAGSRHFPMRIGNELWK